MSLFRFLARHDGGGTAIEYAVLASLIGVASITAFRTLSTRVQATLSNIAHTLG
jgi:Flp pilus assembly pilin Flp